MNFMIFLIAIPLLFVSWSIFLAELVNYLIYQSLNVILIIFLLFISFILSIVVGHGIFNNFKDMPIIKNHWLKKERQIVLLSLSLNNVFVIAWFSSVSLITKNIFYIILLLIMVILEYIFLFLLFHKHKEKLLLQEVKKEKELFHLEFIDSKAVKYSYYSKKEYRSQVSYQCLVDRYSNIVKIGELNE